MNLPHNHNEDATACQFLQEKIGDTEISRLWPMYSSS